MINSDGLLEPLVQEQFAYSYGDTIGRSGYTR